MNPIQPEPGFSILRLGAEAVWIVLAMVGGVARYLDSYVRTGASPKLGLLFAHAAVSGFSGYMVAQTVLKLSPDWALVAAGVGGYLGTQGLDWIASIMKLRFGGELSTTPQQFNTPPKEDPKPSGEPKP